MNRKKQSSKKVDNIPQKSGFTKKQLDILRIFAKEPWKQFTIADVKQITKIKSHHYAYETLKAFTGKGILREDIKGKTGIYSVNYESDNNIEYFSFVEHSIKEDRKDISLNNLKQIQDKIKSPFYSMIVGGSYAEKKQKPTSDLDVAIIIPASESKKTYEIALKEGELMIPEVHGFVFTEEEFYLMLINKEYNYGKEIARKHVIICGAESYYKILFEAMRNGFKG